MRQRQETPREPAERATLEVARVGGGGSARFGALVVVGVLVAVVWVGLSNRPATLPGSTPAGTLAQPVAVGSASPSPTARLTPPAYAYAVGATIEGVKYVTAFDELRPGYLSATLRVPLPINTASGVLTITELWASELRNDSVPVGDWSLPLGPFFSASGEQQQVIDAAMPARPNRDDLPARMRGGFKLNVYAENDLLFGILSIEVLLNPVATARVPPTPTGPPVTARVYDPDDIFGVYVVLGDSQFLTILAESEPGHLTGRLRLPIPPPATQGTFVFQQFSAPSARGQPVPVAQWPIRVEGLVAASGLEYVVVDETWPARRTLLNVPRPVMRGFHITVHAQSGVDSGELKIDIQIGPNQRILGDDGIYGWPVVEQLNVRHRKPIRPRGFYSQCRWDIGPMAARTQPGTDMSECRG